jgi:NAD(P)-dependent dehydrogenase (short-subunit alcohol dehydrogenase family)
LPDAFSGRSALVTGAASGIGAACAKWLDGEGIARLVLVDRDAEGLAALALSCDAERLAGDVGDPHFWDGAAGALAGLDHAVVNAGISGAKPIAETDFDEWRQVMAVNLDGAMLSLKAALLAIEGPGSLVAVASVAALKPLAGLGAYGVYKAALVHMVRIAAAEAAPRGIRVNAIAPGGVDTPIWERQEWFAGVVEALGSREAAMESMARDSLPLGRFESAEEIAGQIGFLLSDAAGTITGTVPGERRRLHALSRQIGRLGLVKHDRGERRERDHRLHLVADRDLPVIGAVLRSPHKAERLDPAQRHAGKASRHLGNNLAGRRARMDLGVADSIAQRVAQRAVRHQHLAEFKHPDHEDREHRKRESELDARRAARIAD